MAACGHGFPGKQPVPGAKMTAAVVTYGHTLWARHCQAWQPSPPPRGTSTPPAPPAQACRLVDQRGESRTGTDTGPSNVRAARNCQATYPVSLPQGLSHRLQTCLQVPWSRQEGWASLRPWSVLCQHQPCSHPTGLSLLWTTPAKGPRPLGGGLAQLLLVFGRPCPRQAF